MKRKRLLVRVIFSWPMRAYTHLRIDAKVDMSTIQLRAEDLYDKEKVDLETIVVEDVFKLLQCTESGLSDEEARRRLELFGPNKLESEEQNPFLQASCLSRGVFFWWLTLPLVPELHVEPALLGHGDCSPRRHRSVQRRGSAS